MWREFLIFAFLLQVNDVGATNGGWRNWGQWTSCQVNGGTGTRERSRKCDNPPPSDLGQNCIGKKRETLPCTKEIVFSATDPKPILVNDIAVFTRSIVNTDNVFDTNTGKFTCPTSGLYEFTASIGKIQGSVTCLLTMNGQHTKFGVLGAMTAYIRLTTGDEVYLSSCINWNNAEGMFFTVFSGKRISD